MNAFLRVLFLEVLRVEFMYVCMYVYRELVGL